jgi:hypothetical protein
LNDFIKTQTGESKLDLIFAGHPIIDLTYESLVADYVGEMRRILDILGVRHEEVKPNTQKQSSKSLSESITNYFELKEKFRGTEWETFFEE